MSEPVIQSIPLDQLELSPANVRKTSAGKTAFAELKASIAAHGLLENLIARAIEPGPEGNVRYAVIAGGRRLTALIDLAREGMLATDYPVPCRVVDDDAPESELSLTENVVRAAMHPADQVEAFAGLATGGATVADIAMRFGVTEKLVEQRLRLGNAAPVLLEAYREGRIDLEVLTAFAVTADRDRQIAVWEQVKEQGYRPGAWQIKRMLTEDRVAARTSIARFVGVEAYETAGGATTRDLFADEDDNGVWLDDPALLDKLATAKLEAAAGEVRSEWKWAEARIEVDWSAIARFGRMVSTPATPHGGGTRRTRTARDPRGRADQSRRRGVDGSAGRGSRRHRGAQRRNQVVARSPGRVSWTRTARSRGASQPSARTASCASSRASSAPKTCPNAKWTARTGAKRTAIMAKAITARLRRRGYPARRHLRSTPAPRRARKRASASGSPTICGPSAPRWSRRILPGTSRRPSISCCSRWAVQCSPAAITPTRWISPSTRPRTGLRCA